MRRLENKINRPPILTKSLTLGENVKGVIRSIDGRLMGLILVDGDNVIIEFLGKVSLCIVFNKESKDLDFFFEMFAKDPKPLIEEVLRGKR